MKEIDQKINSLPLIKSHPKTLQSIFGQSNLLPMWVADMEFEVAKPIQEALINRISCSGFAYEYKPDSFYQAQKRWYKKQYAIDLVKEQTLYSPSITTTISLVLENFTKENNGIIIQPPVFMEFKDIIHKTKRRIVKNPLKLIGKHYQMDYEDLREKAKDKNNKILILCNPHNPVGRVWSKKELKQVVQICLDHDVLLISDEIHKDIILYDHQFCSILNFTDQFEQFVICNSEAKTFNLCGISDSLAIIPNDAIRKNILQSFNRYNLGRTNILTTVALEAAYNNGRDWLVDLIQIIENNIQIINEELKNNSSKIKLIPPEGTYQVWLDFRELFSDSKQMFESVTKNSQVALNAGHWFGREGALFMRMNIATSDKKVREAIQGVIESVK
ncbi:MAG: PatB family C-S lyase [Spirochaetes bacterium]|nr:PatB family C-S lyase [Spirochaetota bacterium]